MKILKTILFLLMIPFILTGCGGKAKKEVEQVVSADLDKLKNLDTGTVEQYISTENLFPDVSESDADANLMEEFVALYFENFDYKILETNVSRDHAKVSLRLNTPDAQSLARDFFTTHLTDGIFAAANDPQGTAVRESSLTDHLNLLNKLIQENNYRTVENNCELSLDRKDNTWIIRKTDDLENEIVGGFISRITDPNLLTPDETLEVYFSTLKQLNDDQLANYLGINSLLMDGDATRASLAAALMKQAKTYYGYKIGRVDQSGYTATVDVQIRTFDYNSILDAYNGKEKEYLATPQAVYDGQAGRLSKSHELLLECVQNNTESTTLDVPVKMVNDGFSWTPVNTKGIGSAIFGTIPDTLTEDPADADDETQSESSTDDSEQDPSGDFDSDSDSDSEEDSDAAGDSDSDSDSDFEEDSDSDSSYEE